jgi:basic membrane protein A
MNRKILILSLVFFVLAAAGLCVAQESAHPVTIGWVMDSRGINDGGFNDAVNAVLSDISRGNNVRVIRVPRLDLYPDKTVADLLAVGATIIIAPDEGGMNGAVSEAARRNPDVKFILVGAEGPPLTNLASILFEEDETGYMAGFIAGTITKTNKIGFIGGAPFDPVVRFERGFIGGVTDANKNAQVTTEYVANEGDVTGFYNRDKTNEIATRLAKKGADVIFTVSATGAYGATTAAEKMKISFIGLANNEANLSPAAAASVVYRFDTAVKRVLVSALSGETIGGIYPMGFENGGLDVAGISKDVGAEKTRKITERKALLSAGKVAVPDYLVLRRKTKLVVSLNIDAPPYEFLSEEGSPAGYIIDVMNEVGRRLGREVVFNSFSGTRIPIGLAAMRSDVEPMVMIDEERTRSFITGEPWGITESVLVVKENNLVPKEIFELISKNVGVVSGSVEERYARKLPGIFSKGYSSTEICLMALAGGEIDAAVVNKEVATYLLSDALRKEDLIMIDKPVLISPYAVAMPRPGDPALLSEIDRALKLMEDDGTIKKISRRWFE